MTLVLCCPYKRGQRLRELKLRSRNLWSRLFEQRSTLAMSSLNKATGENGTVIVTRGLLLVRLMRRTWHEQSTVFEGYLESRFCRKNFHNIPLKKHLDRCGPSPSLHLPTVGMGQFRPLVIKNRFFFAIFDHGILKKNWFSTIKNPSELIPNQFRFPDFWGSAKLTSTGSIPWLRDHMVWK